MNLFFYLPVYSSEKIVDSQEPLLYPAGIKEFYEMKLQAAIERMYERPWLRTALHVLFWAIFWALKVYITGISFNSYRSFPEDRIVLMNLATTVCIAGFYYGLVYFLIPKKNPVRWLGIPLLFIAYTWADSWFEMRIIWSCPSCIAALQNDNPAYFNFLSKDISAVVFNRLTGLGALLLLLFVLCIPLSIKLLLQSTRNAIAAARLAQENLQLELNFLKAQLHPHFLFNTLNNIYGLILHGDTGKSAGLVARLSDLLRYIIYDSNQQLMPLVKEIQVIADYIELEKVRLNFTTITMEYAVDDNSAAIAPLLLMPLVENAFKFCPDTPGSFVRGGLQLQNRKLYFFIENTVSDQQRPAGNGGTGLSNFAKRMELCHKGGYRYETNVSAAGYRANLTVDL